MRGNLAWLDLVEKCRRYKIFCLRICHLTCGGSKRQVNISYYYHTNNNIFILVFKCGTLYKKLWKYTKGVKLFDVIKRGAWCIVTVLSSWPKFVLLLLNTLLLVLWNCQSILVNRHLPVRQIKNCAQGGSCDELSRCQRRAWCF